MKSPTRVTPLHFYQYLKCPSWVWLDAYGQAEQRRKIHPLEEMLWRQGLLHDREIVSNKQFVTVTETDLEEAAAHTLELMRNRTRTIYRGVLLHGPWVARPDLLELVEGRSEFGHYYYVAADVKRTRSLEEVHKFQGAFYALLLEKIQGACPVQGYVLTPEGNLLSFMIDEVREKFHLTLAEIEKILEGKRPPPFLSSGCRESPWQKECVGAAIACDDLSLLAHLTIEEREKLIAAGVDDLKSFALVDLKEWGKKVTGIGRRRLEHLQLQARVLREGKPVLVEQQVFPASSVELYLDIETDPLRDREYLFGILLTSAGGETYVPFFAEGAGEEKEAWFGLMNFLDRYQGAPIYHFGSYEVEVMRRLAEKYGHALEHLEQTIDLGRLVRSAAVFPVYFYSLKDLAKALGFKWRHPEASGLNSIFWYHRWVETENRKYRQDILDYNEDDVRATKLLKEWLEGKVGQSAS